MKPLLSGVKGEGPWKLRRRWVTQLCVCVCEREREREGGREGGRRERGGERERERGGGGEREGERGRGEKKVHHSVSSAGRSLPGSDSQNIPTPSHSISP